jgi:hypothetical protein
MASIDPSVYSYLYRAIRNKRWYKNREVLSVAFRLRANEVSLSLLKSVHCSIERCSAELNECYGELILETAKVTSLGLEVVDDEQETEPYDENHANIVGIPVEPQTDEDLKSAWDLASALASIARLHYDRYGRFG